MAGLPNSFEEFTLEQIEYWVREVRPLLIEMRERSMTWARQRALAHIRSRREPASVPDLNLQAANGSEASES